MSKSQAKRAKIVEVGDVSYIVDQNTGEMVEVLQDKTSTGRVRPWAKHKASNLELEDIYRDIGGNHFDSKADRLHGCGAQLEFAPVKDDKGNIIRMRVIKTNSCHVRLCPICGWRRSLKVQGHTTKIIESLDPSYEYLLLTLTVPNCKAHQLKAMITLLLTAFNRLSKYKAFVKVVRGWYRGLEVTHNVNPYSKSYDTYHPHIHIILVVDKSYFKHDYIKQEDWLKMWQKATGDPTITQVDIRKIRPKKGTNNIRGAVCETAKYTVKSDDYIVKDRQLSIDAVKTLDEALAGRRLVAYGGVMKDAHKALNLDDETDGDLTNVSGDVIGDADPSETICYYYHIGYGQYVKK